MAQLRYLIDTDTESKLRKLAGRLDLDQKDPTKLYKGKFVEYLAAKADAAYDDYMAAGMTADAAVAKAREDLSHIVSAWKAEARRRKGVTHV